MKDAIISSVLVFVSFLVGYAFGVHDTEVMRPARIVQHTNTNNAWLKPGLYRCYMYVPVDGSPTNIPAATWLAVPEGAQ